MESVDMHSEIACYQSPFASSTRCQTALVAVHLRRLRASDRRAQNASAGLDPPARTQRSAPDAASLDEPDIPRDASNQATIESIAACRNCFPIHRKKAV